MRQNVIDSIFERMRTDSSLFFLTADMGINLVERFADAYPERYANVGIAEQNLISVSAGLANLGYRPVAYTISNFLIHRCFEQIRNDIGLHGYPITLIGTSTGFDNAPLGPTHHIVDEWGVLKSVPGIDIYCPSSITYATGVIESILQADRPAYVRVPKGAHLEPASNDHLVKLRGKADDILLVSYGNPAQACIDASRQDNKLSVLVVNKLHPLNEERLIEAIKPHRRILVVEDHFPLTGLYGSLCEVVLRHSLSCRVKSVAPKHYAFEVGRSPEYFSKKFGIDLHGILALTRE